MLSLKLVPWGRVGIAAGILAVTFLAAAWKIEERRADKLQAQVVKWQTADAKRQVEQKRRDEAAARIAKEEKARHEKELATIRADAAELRLSGPGAARCGPVSTPATSGHRQGTTTPGAPVGPVPDGEGQPLIGMPFPGAVNLARNHDALRAEVLAWRAWHAELVKAWGVKK